MPSQSIGVFVGSTDVTGVGVAVGVAVTITVALGLLVGTGVVIGVCCPGGVGVGVGVSRHIGVGVSRGFTPGHGQYPDSLNSSEQSTVGVEVGVVVGVSGADVGDPA